MSKTLMFVGSTIGSYAGWWLGAHIGVMSAFTVSMIGTGVGLYAGRKAAAQYE